ncbi:MAG: hypothetical protein CVT62_05350 [Actinobacteria bacterium HGW-Actinobacteria-2]|nr:MAG: hypothetical protein CVT62_05350 [Actinobacteria bacterium HGW-Actinobacteria-2]
MTSDDLAEHVAELREAMDGIARVLAEDPGATADLVLMILARPLGAWMDIEPETIRLLGSAGCGLSIDAYDSTRAKTMLLRHLADQALCGAFRDQ